MKVVVLEVGNKLRRRASRQQDSHLLLHPSVHRDREWSSGFEIVGTFADITVVCRVLGTQPLLIGALFSVDHSCDNRGLEHFINYWKIGVIWRGKTSTLSSYLVFERQLLSDLSVRCVKPIWSFRV